MKIFMAALATETNTFSPIPTGRESFMGREWFRHDASRHPPVFANIAMKVWRARAEADGHEVIESLAAFAPPAGTTLQTVYEELRDLILDDLRAALPVDMVLLFMHGAMVAYGYDDCEGDTLARVRALAGTNAAIGIELDLHCHLTEQMRDNADVIITFKEYPHIDMAERAHELYALCQATALGQIRPVIAYHDCRMINMWRTPMEPMKSFVARMQALEGHDGILSVSFGHGFPWADVDEVGAKFVVVADADPDRAAALAAQLGQELWTLRHETAAPHDSIDSAIDAALAAQQGPGPVVLADVADNAGGGAPSDNTTILRRLLDRGVTDAAIGCFWDPVSVMFCFEAGAGASLMLRIGGKCGTASGDPVDLLVTIMGLATDYTAPGLSGGTASMGNSAWVRANGIDMVLSSKRNQVFAPELFTGLGVTLSDKRMVVVKSTQHFHAAFAPIAAQVRYVAAPGAIPPEFETIAYTKRTKPYWPRVADPFALVNEG